MIARVLTTVGAATPAAATAVVGEQAVAKIVPTVWYLLGYPIEAGSLIAGVCACIAVRFYVGIGAGQHRWVLDIPVSALTLMFTVGMLLKLRPEPLGALLLGTGLGILGAGIIAIAKEYLDQVLGPLALNSSPQPESEVKP